MAGICINVKGTESIFESEFLTPDFNSLPESGNTCAALPSEEDEETSGSSDSSDSSASSAFSSLYGTLFTITAPLFFCLLLVN
jgi:hypothetical protein